MYILYLLLNESFYIKYRRRRMVFILNPMSFSWVMVMRSVMVG